jgi:hypothetical protein
MNNFFPYILGITETLNEWNEKLSDLVGGHMDNAFMGALVVGVVFVVAAWGISTLNKK